MGVQERKEREREARRRALLDAARELLRERGFAAITTKAIAHRCELSEATLFWYFENKDDVLTTLIFEGVEIMARRFDEILARDTGPRDKLAALLGFFAEFRATNPEYFRVFSNLAYPDGGLTIRDDKKAELVRHSGDLFRRVAVLISEIAGPDEAKLRADVLWSAMHGLTVLRDTRHTLALGAKVHPTDSELARATEMLLEGIVGPATPRKGKRT